MSKYPPGDRDKHQAFCEIEGWQVRPSARGRAGQDHVKYELRLDDGRVLLTRISHPVDRTTYGRTMWAHILRDQLDVTDSEFWACVRDEVLPARSQPVEEPPSLPVWLVKHLLDAGTPQQEIAGMNEAQAQRRLGQIWSTGG